MHPLELPLPLVRVALFPICERKQVCKGKSNQCPTAVPNDRKRAKEALMDDGLWPRAEEGRTNHRGRCYRKAK